MNTLRSKLTLRQAILQGLGAISILSLSSVLLAADLQSIEYERLADGKVQIKMTLSEPISSTVESFKIDNPPRVAIDLPQVKNQSGIRTDDIGVGAIQSVRLAETQDRTRVVFNLISATGYDIVTEDNTVLVTFSDSSSAAPTIASTGQVSASSAGQIDFRRGPSGEGRLIIDVGSTDTPMKMRREGLNLIVELPGTLLDAGRFDVRDFATPVDRIDIRRSGRGSVITLQTRDAGEHLAWQTGNRLTVEVKPIPPRESLDPRQAKEYTGERLTLKFQDIEIRPLLQLLADFTGNNIVVSDSVSGSMSLRLENVPWDQALDLILTTNGLSARQNGNVIFVAPTAEMIARDEAELAARRQSEELAPLVTDIVQINYAKADDIAQLLRTQEGAVGYITERGSITVDARTNTLIINDVPDALRRVRELIDRLDTPVKQVLIETRIVVATDNFAHELGARWGVTSAFSRGDTTYVSTGSGTGSGAMADSAISNINNTGSAFPVTTPGIGERWNINLPVSNPTGRFGLAILRSNVLLDLELSALQAEGTGEIISSPKVITANGHTALIKQGQEIPYVVPQQGALTVPQVDFKEAVLSTEVTPQITPNNNIILDIKVTKDEADFTRVLNGNPPLNKREIQTKVQVRNGETVVLGGIYEFENTYQTDKVPFLGDLPAIGNLFKRNAHTNRRFELLIFVTPKIIENDTMEIAASY